MTSVCDSREGTFESWNDGTTAPSELFSPTTLQKRMDHISKMVTEREVFKSMSEHALLFIDHQPGDFKTVSQIEMTAEEKQSAARKLHVSSAGVCILTQDTTILGNVIEPSNSMDEGTAKAIFLPSRIDVPVNERRMPSIRRTDGQASRRLVESVTESHSEHILWRLPPPMSAFEAFSREVSTPSVPAREGLKSSEPRTKRPRVGEQTYSIKRFKGPTIENIFGRNPSSRRL